MLEHIREGEAPAELAGTFRDLKHGLRLSYVPLFFQALAPVHGALKSAWRLLKPNVTTRAFEEQADELRAELVHAAVDLGTPLIEPVLQAGGFDGDELDELRDQVLLLQYADPKLLLCVEALVPALEGVTVGGARLPAELLAKLPDVPEGELPELHLTNEHPGGVVGEVFREILATTHLTVPTVGLRALAHWPTFVELAWEELAPIFRHRRLEVALNELSSSAARRARELPYPIEFGPDAFESPAHRAHVARIAGIFADALPRLAFFSAALRVSLDGPQDALDSPYPVEWEPPAIEPLGL